MEFHKLAQGHGFTSKVVFWSSFFFCAKENLHNKKIPWEENPGPQLLEQILFQSTFHCYTASLQYVPTPNLVDRDTAEVVGLNPLCLVHFRRAISVGKQETHPGSFHQPGDTLNSGLPQLPISSCLLTGDEKVT